MMKRFQFRHLLSAAAIMAIALSAGQALAQPSSALTLDDYDSIAELSSSSLSPDSSRVAVIVSHVDRAANIRRSELAVVSTRGGTPQIVVTGQIDAISWSPDGASLAWIAHDSAGAARLHIAASDALASPRTLGTAPLHGDVVRFTWSKDSRSIAYLAKPTPEADTADKSFEIADADYLGTTYLARDNGGPPQQLWIVAAASGEPRRLDSGTGFPQDLAWQADGKALFVQTQPGASVAATLSASLLSVPIDGSQAEVVITSPAPIGTGSRLGVSNDGAVAFQHFRGPDPWTEVNNVAIYRDGKITVATQALDRQIDDFKWLPGSQGILVRADDHSRTRLWRISETGKITPINFGNLNVLAGLDVNATGAISFVGGSASGPADLYYMASTRARPVRLTHFGDALAGKRLGKVETVGWSSGGFDHDGVVVYPPDYDKTKAYPLLVDIHGGPEASSREAFDFSAHYYAARGWVVFQPNYRGSSGQGNSYQTAILGDLVKGSGEDVLAGVDKIVATLPIDSKRVAVTGWSWGGVLTSWLIGHDQRWCAAIPGAMAVDFTGYYDQSETAIWIRTMLGSPYVSDNIARYRETSPATYLKNAVTPTLIIHNVGDPNAPVTQSYTLYHALKDRGIKTKMVLRGIDGHGYGDPFSHKQVHSLTFQWLSENCGGPVTQ